MTAELFTRQSADPVCPIDRRLVDRVGGLGDNHEVAKVRLVGAAGGALFAMLVVAALAIAPGPSSASGVDVVEYYSTHKHATAHYHETGDPVMRSIEPGEAWRWCFEDELLG